MDSLSVTLLCAYDALQRHFRHAGEADIQDYAPALHIFTGTIPRIAYYYYYYYSESDAHTDAPFSAAFIQVQIPGYFVANLINLKNADVLFFCINHDKSHII